MIAQAVIGLRERGEPVLALEVADRGRHRIGMTTAAATWSTGQPVDQVERRHRRVSALVVADQLGGTERQIERLATVEPRVAHRLVAVVEVGVDQLVAATDALGDVFAGELDVDAAGPGALGAVGPDEAFDLGDDRLEVAGLAPGGAGVGVAVHRVARPHDGMAAVA